MAVSGFPDHAVTQQSSLDKSCSEGALSSLSSLPSSPRQYPTDLSGSVLEEGDESASESPNEPITPVSGRQSQDFHPLHTHDTQADANQLSLAASESSASAFSAIRPETTPGIKAPLVISTAPTPSPKPAADGRSRPAGSSTTGSVASSTEPDPIGTPLSRRSTRSSTTGFKRTMSNLFRRSNSQSDKAAFGLTEPPTAAASDSNLAESQPKAPGRRWSMNKSSATTRSNSPPSPSSPLEMASKTREQATKPTVPSSEDFLQKKKNRASTGFNLGRRAVNFVTGPTGPNGPPNNNGATNNGAAGEPRRARPVRRRASSFDYSKQGLPAPAPSDPNNPSIQMDRSFWAMPADAGTGVKARRMSLSLPDDFWVDVVELSAEFEYQSKLLGRHGRHLGKGATSKVIIMARKGFQGELYAVKEFRGKSSSETAAEYEKKIKSEYSIAKSLHHPNVVETVRLCTDHGRWNHVMEYCSEGDLFSLVQKGYLKKDEREKDRTCFFKQLVQGIHYLHSNGIAHRDIKLENLLITRDSKLKITDFGVSEVFSGIHPGLREAGGQCGVGMGEVRFCAPGICGSEPYIAPEVLAKKAAYDARALDVWSAAIVMLHLIFGGALWTRAQEGPNNPLYNTLVKGWGKWHAKHPGQGADTISDTSYPAVAVLDQFVKPPALRRLLLQMLHPDPAGRITMADVIANRWMRNVECCQFESYDDPTCAAMIDASKKGTLKQGTRKIFCHNHLPPAMHTSHSLGKMPGTAGY